MNKLRVKHGDNEIEIEGTDDFIKVQLAEFYTKVQEVSPRPPSSKIKRDMLEAPAKPPAGKEPAPAEYYRQKGREDGISQILIFGKYLEEYRGMSEFSREDVNNLGKEVKLPKNIHSQYFTNAVKQGLLRSHGGGKYSLTLSAESVISSM
jgi:hypothetical protein